jgi:excinuclease ABC subunit B
MYRGDRSRKETLVEYGFRLPSALDNRPLRFDEFEARVNQAVYVSATPASYELERAGNRVVQQIIRPTGLVDPEMDIRPASSQVDDLLEEIRRATELGERVLVTTLTKRMAEDLTDYLQELDIKVQYLHSDVDTLDRTVILRDLRLGIYDVVVGINLLREGLDLPEVSLVAILDADKEGFLRSEAALIQTVGRASRHVDGTVIMYADRMTDSMRRAIGETNRRRQKQLAHNQAYGIAPRSVVKAIQEMTQKAETARQNGTSRTGDAGPTTDDLLHTIDALEQEMQAAATELAFEKAARLRDRVVALRRQLEAIEL